MKIPGKEKEPHSEEYMIPQGRYLFSVLTASQVDAGGLKEWISMTLRIERGIYEGRLVRFFKPVLTVAQFEDEDNEIRFMNYPHPSDHGMLVMSYAEWMGIMFYADLVFESPESTKAKFFLRNINRVVPRVRKGKQ